MPGSVPGATLVVTLHYNSAGVTDPLIFFFDPQTQTTRQIPPSNRVTFDKATHTVRIVFDDTSFPTIGSLKKTVFTISVGTPTTSTTTSLTPATALAATRNNGSATDSSSGGVTLSFQTSSKVSVNVNASQDSARAAASGSSNGNEDDDSDDPPDDGKDPAKKKGDKAKKPDDKGKKPDDKSTPPAPRGMKTEMNGGKPDGQMQAKPGEELTAKVLDESSPDSLDAYFVWSAGGIGLAMTPLAARRDKKQRPDLLLRDPGRKPAKSNGGSEGYASPSRATLEAS